MPAVESLLASIDDSEVLSDLTMAVDSSLESVEDAMSINKLSKDGLVAIKVACLAEGDSEFRATRVLAFVGCCELSTLEVSERVLILESNAESTEVLLTHAAS